MMMMFLLLLRVALQSGVDLGLNQHASPASTISRQLPPIAHSKLVEDLFHLCAPSEFGTSSVTLSLWFGFEESSGRSIGVHTLYMA